MKKKKFNQVWCSQSVLGDQFGLSAITVGKILIEEGLKDKATKGATRIALSAGFARATPLKDGTPYFMWNIEKVRPIIEKDHAPLDAVSYWARKVEATLRQASKMADEGNDKLGYMMADYAYDEVPENIREAVRAKADHASPFAD